MHGKFFSLFFSFTSGDIELFRSEGSILMYCVGMVKYCTNRELENMTEVCLNVLC